MRKTEATIVINCSSEKIIEAFTNTSMLKDWWGVEKSLIEKRTGGMYTLAWKISNNGMGFVSTGTIKEYDPGGLLVIENFVYLNPEKSFLGPMTLTIKATQQQQGTELYICQDGYREDGDWDWYYDVVKNAWPMVAVTIKTYLEKIQ